MPATSLAAASAALLAMSALAQTTVEDSQCDCFVTNGTTPTYFKSHGFWDFRSLPQHAVVNPPGLKLSAEESADADFTTPYLDFDSEFGEFWALQNWGTTPSEEDEDGGLLPNQNSFNNLYIERNRGHQSETYLAMRTARLDTFQTSAEFESREQLDHVSMRMHSLTTGTPGACTSIFTYRNEEGEEVEETDIEILTRDPGSTIRYTNQPSYNATIDDVVPGASNAVSLPSGSTWDGWHTHRLDWTPGLTTWFVDGEETFDMTFQVPVKPAQVLLNVWSNGDEGWTGKMPVGGKAYQYVQWIELLYGVTEEGECKRLCSVDLSPEIGRAVRV
jgi:hypothetical protein